MQNGLYDLAMSYLYKAFKTDLNLFEVDSNFQHVLCNWKGRQLILNIFAYYFSYIKVDHVAAISFIQESLEIAHKLDEKGATLRDMDYLV